MKTKPTLSKMFQRNMIGRQRVSFLSVLCLCYLNVEDLHSLGNGAWLFQPHSSSRRLTRWVFVKSEPGPHKRKVNRSVQSAKHVTRDTTTQIWSKRPQHKRKSFKPRRRFMTCMPTKPYIHFSLTSDKIFVLRCFPVERGESNNAQWDFNCHQEQGTML